MYGVYNSEMNCYDIYLWDWDRTIPLEWTKRLNGPDTILINGERVTQYTRLVDHMMTTLAFDRLYPVDI